jgi:glycolate oxidase FAD binding subunit
MLDGRGDDLSFGGRVMKNVAGFDVPRLMTGALGTLGVLIEISLKCLPMPKAEATRLFACSAEESIRHVNEWGGAPLPLSATCWHQGVLAVRLSGALPAVEAAVATLGGEVSGDADGGDGFWRSVRDHSHRHFASAVAAGAPLWRLSVRSTAPHAELGGEQLIEWGGALRWLVAGAGADPGRLRAWARSHGGHATLFRAPDRTDSAFEPLPPAIAGIHARLKSAFDPAGIFNRGRLYATF